LDGKDFRHFTGIGLVTSVLIELLTCNPAQGAAFRKLLAVRSVVRIKGARKEAISVKMAYDGPTICDTLRIPLPGAEPIRDIAGLSLQVYSALKKSKTYTH
jgi:hypothetical protein